MTSGPPARGHATADQVAAVTARARAELDIDTAARPRDYGYPDGLALCVIDSVQSTGVTYASVEGVVGRYRSYRRDCGADPDTDGVAQLLATFTELDGTDGWAATIGNGNRVSTRPGAPLKAAAIAAAGRALLDAGVDTTHHLRDAVADRERSARIGAAWASLPGQRSGITWHYMLMLAGVPGVKPDRMIKRFVADALAVPVRGVDEELARTAVIGAAATLGVSPTDLDHLMWQWQRRRRARR